MEDLAEYHRHSPQEVDALMAHSAIACRRGLPKFAAPVRIPEFNNDDAGKNTGSPSARYFPDGILHVLMNISRFVCRVLGGFHEEIREFRNQA